MSAFKYPNVFLLKKIISPKSRKMFTNLVGIKSRHRSASLTVEAALVLPVFFFVFFLLWQCFLLLMFQLKVCEQVTGIAAEVSFLGYAQRTEQEVPDTSLLYEPLIWAAVPENERVQNKWISCREDGEKAIQVRVVYEFVCEAVFFSKIRLPIEQTFCFYPYRGEMDEENTEEEGKDVVYVTEHGRVYHESKACVYLNVVLTPVMTSQLADIRNSYGERYGECARCHGEPEAGQVFVSKAGDRYHKSLNCPAVKRNVQEKSRDEIGDMPACHKCGEEEN